MSLKIRVISPLLQSELTILWAILPFEQSSTFAVSSSGSKETSSKDLSNGCGLLQGKPEEQEWQIIIQQLCMARCTPIFILVSFADCDKGEYLLLWSSVPQSRGLWWRCTRTLPLPPRPGLKLSRTVRLRQAEWQSSVYRIKRLSKSQLLLWKPEVYVFPLQLPAQSPSPLPPTPR